MHDDEREVDEGRAGPPTDQVRIVGAARAGDALEGSPLPMKDEGPSGSTTEATATTGATTEVAAQTEIEESSEATEEGESAADAQAPHDASGETQLLHWTDAPTGEVPAVLSRGGDSSGDDPWATVPEPTWREQRRDWEQEDPFAPPHLAPADVAGQLISERDMEERQPWSFDLGEHPGEQPGPDELEGVDEFEDLDAEDPFESWAPDSQSGAAGEPGAADEPTVIVPSVAAEQMSPVVEQADVVERLDVVEVEEARASAWKEGDEEAAAFASDIAARGGGRARSLWPRPARVTEAGKSARVPRERQAAAAPRRAGRNIPAAVASGVVVGALALIAFHFGTVPSMIVVTAVVVLAAIEAFAAFRRAAYRPATLLGVAAVVALLVASYDVTLRALPVVIVLLVVFTFLWHLIGVDPDADPLRSAASTLLVFCWIGVFGSFGALLLSPSLFPHRTGIAYLLGALIAAVSYDVGALAVGATLGRHPLSSVSPKKTWEGVIGGAVVAIVICIVVLHLIHPWTISEAATLGVVVAVVSPVGDLCESLVKRRLGLKDMGRILPGHGGFLDRVDGLLFVLPATYYLLRAFGHG